jgi:ABC-type antimicrobial peptide transport system permease subunit
MAVKVTGDPASHATRLQAIANSVDPSLRLYDLQRLDQLDRGGLVMFAIYLRVALLLSAVALLLSLAGIYAVMSFTVSRRMREIGIRVALGADPRRIVLTIFRRPLTQVSLGILAGGGLSALLAFRVIGSGLTPRNGALLLGYAALMMGVCMLACILPTRRALRVHPTDALREDG